MDLRKKPVNRIICPYCSSKIVIVFLKRKYGCSWGVVSCKCDKYPIIDGIFYMLKDDKTTNRTLVDLIVNNDELGSLRLALSRTGRLYGRLVYLVWSLSNLVHIKLSRKIVLRLFIALKIKGDWFRYLLHRDEWKDITFAKRGLRTKRIVDTNCVVDLGCGLGDGINILTTDDREMVFGVDKNIDILLLNKMWSNKQVLICGDIEEGLPFITKSIDLVTMFSAFNLIHNKWRFAVELGRIMRKGGSIIVTDIGDESTEVGYGVSPSNLVRIFKHGWCNLEVSNENDPSSRSGKEVSLYAQRTNR